MTSPITSARSRRKRRTTSTGPGMGPSFHSAHGQRFVPPCYRERPAGWPIVKLHHDVPERDRTHDTQGMARVARHVIRLAFRPVGERLAPEIHEDRSAAGAVTRFHVVQNVAEE